MTRIKAILSATVLTLALSTSAFAGDITGRKGDITGKSGDITGKTMSVAGDITGLYGALLNVISVVV